MFLCETWSFWLIRIKTVGYYSVFNKPKVYVSAMVNPSVWTHSLIKMICFTVKYDYFYLWFFYDQMQEINHHYFMIKMPNYSYLSAFLNRKKFVLVFECYTWSVSAGSKFNPVNLVIFSFKYVSDKFLKYLFSCIYDKWSNTFVKLCLFYLLKIHLYNFSFIMSNFWEKKTGEI